MNRNQRRAALRMKRLDIPPHEIAHQQRLRARRLATAPWKIDQVLSPILQVLDAIERTGCVDAERSGRPIFRDVSAGEWYALVPAIRGVVETWEIADHRHGWCLDYSPLRRIATRLDVMTPITIDDIAAARACVESMRQAMGALSVGEAIDIVTTTQIQIALENKEMQHE